MYHIIFLVLILLNQSLIKAVNLNAVLYSYQNDANFYHTIVNDFNDYAKANNLDINVKFIMQTPLNSTGVAGDYTDYLNHILNRQSKEFDIYFFYSGQSKQFGPHLVNLNEFIPKEQIDLYNYEYVKTVGVLDDELVAMPISTDVSVLYSNKQLLAKYNKSVPKTWDELIDTAKYIKNMESQLYGNNDLIGYNGLINEESGLSAIYEFIRSFRKSKNDPHPELNSDITREALQKLKQVKDEVSSDEYFKAKDDLTVANLFSPQSKAIFLKFWYLPNPFFESSPLPGGREGVTGSVPLNNNVGICKYIGEEKIKAAGEVVKFFSSFEEQKKVTMMNLALSPIVSVYDEQVCQNVNCDVINAMQPFESMDFSLDQFGSMAYMEKYSAEFADYLYGEKDLETSIKNIDDVLAVHYISFKAKETKIMALSIFVVVLLVCAFMAMSLIFLKMRKFKMQLSILPNKFWVLAITGSILLVCTILTALGKESSFKCRLRFFCITVGYNLNILPVLYILIVKFPKRSTFARWVVRNRNTFIIMFISIELILNALYYYSPVSVRDIKVENGENYQVCHYTEGKTSKILFYAAIVIQALILVTLTILAFMERHIEDAYEEIKILIGIMFINLLTLIIYFVIYFLHIKSYIVYYASLISAIFIIAITNYFLTYPFRIIRELMNDNSEMYNNQMILKSMNKTKQYNTYNYSGNMSINNYPNYNYSGNSSSGNGRQNSSYNNSSSHNNSSNGKTFTNTNYSNYSTNSFSNPTYPNYNSSTNGYNGGIISYNKNSSFNNYSGFTGSQSHNGFSGNSYSNNGFSGNSYSNNGFSGSQSQNGYKKYNQY